LVRTPGSPIDSALINAAGAIDTPGVTSFSYSYDANKNKTAETIGGVMSGYSTSSVTYDEIDRLVQYAQSRGFQRSWQLSPVGDWNRVTTDGTDQLRTHGPTHEILSVDGSALEHDAKGNVTFIPAQARASGSTLRLLWGFDNELQAVDADGDGLYETTYRYDALQRRVAKTTDGNTTVTVFHMMQELAEYRSGDPAGSPQAVWVYATYVDEPLLVRRADGSQYYFHQNSQYSVAALTDSAGNVVERYAYTAYGSPTILAPDGVTERSESAFNNPVLFTGRRWDSESALYYYRARYYDPVLGRFLCWDPIRYDGGLHLYAYTGNRPSAFVDPTGLHCTDWSWTPIAMPRTARGRQLGWFFYQWEGWLQGNYGSRWCRNQCDDCRWVTDEEVSVSASICARVGVGIGLHVDTDEHIPPWSLRLLPGIGREIRVFGYIGGRGSASGCATFTVSASTDRCHGVDFRRVKGCVNVPIDFRMAVGVSL